MKIFFFDLETTGTKFWRNGIHQISGIVDINGEVKEQFNFHVKPVDKCDIEIEALNVTGVTIEQVMAYPEMVDVYVKLTSLLSKYVDRFNKQDKFFLCGYNNASFDNPFFRAFFVQNGDKYFGSYFWSASLDVMVLAAEHLKGRRHLMKDFKLQTVCQEMGVPFQEDQAHDALYDIVATRNLYYKITNPEYEMH